MENISNLCDKSYIPTHSEYLMCRSRTTGIIESEVNVKGTRFKVRDVGGARSERRKVLESKNRTLCYFSGFIHLGINVTLFTV